MKTRRYDNEGAEIRQQKTRRRRHECTMTRKRNYEEEDTMFIVFVLSYCRVLASSSSYLCVLVVAPLHLRNRYLVFSRVCVPYEHTLTRCHFHVTLTLAACFRYMDSVAPDQSVRHCSLIWELHYQLICKLWFNWLINGQCSLFCRTRKLIWSYTIRIWHASNVAYCSWSVNLIYVRSISHDVINTILNF